jgi:trehalose synthase
MPLRPLQKIKTSPKHLIDYRQFNPETVNQIYRLANSLKGLRITHLNSTSVGGGVAEILQILVPLQKDIGLHANWYIIPPNKSFFEVTKKIHNLLQGKKGNLSSQQKRIYSNYNRYIGSLLSKIQTDILIVHDPQPLGSVGFLKSNRPQILIWRCHIDTSHPNEAAWKFLRPYLNNYDHFIFTLPEYASSFLPFNKISTITPVIDPLSTKNVHLNKTGAKIYLEKLGIDTSRPLVTQVSRFDPWKDPWGVIDAYLIAKRKFPELQLALVAQNAIDDPEGIGIYQQIRTQTKKEKDIFIFMNLPDNDTAVNAFQTASDIILQKSIREGFGLTVTEAMFKGAIVIGGNVGGIKLQITDGINGFLVNSPLEAAQKIIHILKNPQIRGKISKKARVSVRKKFLVTNKLLDYLNLFKKLLAKKDLDY